MFLHLHPFFLRLMNKANWFLLASQKKKKANWFLLVAQLGSWNVWTQIHDNLLCLGFWDEYGHENWKLDMKIGQLGSWNV